MYYRLNDLLFFYIILYSDKWVFSLNSFSIGIQVNIFEKVTPCAHYGFFSQHSFNLRPSSFNCLCLGTTRWINEIEGMIHLGQLASLFKNSFLLTIQL